MPKNFYCGLCGQELRQREGFGISASELLKRTYLPEPIEAEMRDDGIAVFGGSSPYTRSHPYFIGRDDFDYDRKADTGRAVVDWLAHLSGKRWFHGSRDVRKVGMLLVQLAES